MWARGKVEDEKEEEVKRWMILRGGEERVTKMESGKEWSGGGGTEGEEEWELQLRWIVT